MSSSGAGIYSQQPGSDFFHASRRDTALSISAFVVLLSMIVGVASVTFGWDWIPQLFLAFLALSAVLLVRSRGLGKPRAAYQESVHLTTATFGLLSSLVLLVQQLT